MIQICKKLGILSILKKINEKPSTHIIPNGESPNNFPLKLATRQG
jgi:hypothetical protein